MFNIHWQVDAAACRLRVAACDAGPPGIIYDELDMRARSVRMFHYGACMDGTSCCPEWRSACRVVPQVMGPCGSVGEPCCAEGTCTLPSWRGGCVQGHCVSVGQAGQPCGPNDWCDDRAALRCTEGHCLPCGWPGMACCAGGQCVGANECVNGACRVPLTTTQCGDSGQPCCSPGEAGIACGFAVETGPCVGGRCLDCGHAGEFCCSEAMPCPDAVGLVCDGTYCLECGFRGQACCPGSVCRDDSTCVGNFCVVPTTTTNQG
jgi:hypothetical protein